MLEELRNFFENHKNVNKKMKTTDDRLLDMQIRFFSKQLEKDKNGMSCLDRQIDYLVKNKKMELDEATRKVISYGLKLNGHLPKSPLADFMSDMGNTLHDIFSDIQNKADKENLEAALKATSASTFLNLKTTVEEFEKAITQNPEDKLYHSHAAARFYAEYAANDNILNAETKSKINYEQLTHTINAQEAIQQKSEGHHQNLKGTLNDLKDEIINRINKQNNKVQLTEEEKNLLRTMLGKSKNHGDKLNDIEDKMSHLLANNEDIRNNLHEINTFVNEQREMKKRIEEFQYKQGEIDGLHKVSNFMNVLGSITGSMELVKIGQMGQGFAGVLSSVNSLSQMSNAMGPLALAGGYANVGVAVLSLASSFMDQGPSEGQIILGYLKSLGEFMEKHFDAIHTELATIHKDMIDLFKHSDQLIRTRTEIISLQIQGLSKFVAYQFKEVGDALNDLRNKLENIKNAHEISSAAIENRIMQTQTLISAVMDITQKGAQTNYLAEYESLYGETMEYVLGRLPSLSREKVEKLMGSFARTWAQIKSSNNLLTGQDLYDFQNRIISSAGWNPDILESSSHGYIKFIASFIENKRQGVLARHNIDFNKLVNPDVFLGAVELYLAILEKSPGYETREGIKRIDELTDIINNNIKFIEFLKDVGLEPIVELYDEAYENIFNKVDESFNEVKIYDKNGDFFEKLKNINVYTMSSLNKFSESEIVDLIGKNTVYDFGHGHLEINRKEYEDANRVSFSYTLDNFILYRWIYRFHYNNDNWRRADEYNRDTKWKEDAFGVSADTWRGHKIMPMYSCPLHIPEPFVAAYKLKIADIYGGIFIENPGTSNAFLNRYIIFEINNKKIPVMILEGNREGKTYIDSYEDGTPGGILYQYGLRDYGSTWDNDFYDKFGDHDGKIRQYEYIGHTCKAGDLKHIHDMLGVLEQYYFEQYYHQAIEPLLVPVKSSINDFEKSLRQMDAAIGLMRICQSLAGEINLDIGILPDSNAIIDILKEKPPESIWNNWINWGGSGVNNNQQLKYFYHALKIFDTKPDIQKMQVVYQKKNINSQLLNEFKEMVSNLENAKEKWEMYQLLYRQLDKYSKITKNTVSNDVCNGKDEPVYSNGIAGIDDVNILRCVIIHDVNKHIFAARESLSYQFFHMIAQSVRYVKNEWIPSLKVTPSFDHVKTESYSANAGYGRHSFFSRQAIIRNPESIKSIPASDHSHVDSTMKEFIYVFSNDDTESNHSLCLVDNGQPKPVCKISISITSLPSQQVAYSRTENVIYNLNITGNTITINGVCRPEHLQIAMNKTLEQLPDYDLQKWWQNNQKIALQSSIVTATSLMAGDYALSHGYSANTADRISNCVRYTAQGAQFVYDFYNGAEILKSAIPAIASNIVYYGLTTIGRTHEFATDASIATQFAGQAIVNGMSGVYGIFAGVAGSAAGRWFAGKVADSCLGSALKESFHIRLQRFNDKACRFYQAIDDLAEMDASFGVVKLRDEIDQTVNHFYTQVANQPNPTFSLYRQLCDMEKMIDEKSIIKNDFTYPVFTS